MIAVNTHYSIAMRPSALKVWAKDMAHDIMELCSDGGFPILIYSGMSGITAATALSLNFNHDFKHGLAYVRKNSEKSHGCKIERGGDYPETNEEPSTRYIFVDDFYATGDTAKRAITLFQMNQFMEIASDKIFEALTTKGAIAALTQKKILSAIKRTNKKIVTMKASRALALKEFADSWK